MISLTSVPAFRRGYRLQWEESQSTYVVLYPEGMAKLNETAAAILQFVDGQRALAGIVSELRLKYPQAPDDLDHDVVEFIVRVVEKKWVILHEEK